METLRITGADIKDGKYIKGAIDFEGHIEIKGNLGWVSFTSIRAKGYIFAEAGTGIKAGEGIEAGEGIKAGEGIEAGTGIKAGWGIEAGTGIKAGEGIKAGGNISAGSRIFAGLMIWRKPIPEEMTIHCKKLTKGEVAYGILEEGAHK